MGRSTRSLARGRMTARCVATHRNQMYRLYREEHLQLRSKLPKRRKMVVVRRQRVRPSASNDVWSLDFVSDQLANGARFRALTVVDIFSREALAIEVGQRLAANMWWRYSIDLPRSVKPLSICSSTMAANSRVGCWTCGRTIGRLESTSVGRVSRRTTATSKPSTVPYETSA